MKEVRPISFSEELRDFIIENSPAQFKPFAYYDKHLDCIRAQFIDCSFTEERKNRFITILHANHMNKELVGFNIKRVRYLFEQMGLGVNGVHHLATILNKLVKLYPDAAIEKLKRDFLPLVKEENLSVTFG